MVTAWIIFTANVSLFDFFPIKRRQYVDICVWRGPTIDIVCHTHVRIRYTRNRGSESVNAIWVDCYWLLDCFGLNQLNATFVFLRLWLIACQLSNWYKLRARERKCGSRKTFHWWMYGQITINVANTSISRLQIHVALLTLRRAQFLGFRITQCNAES